MKTTFEYIVMFITSVLVQVLLFDNIEFSWWIRPVVFPLFVLLLPMEMSNLKVMLCSMFLGLTIDILAGVPGVYTATMLVVGIVRRLLLLLFAGRLSIQDGGVPLSSRIGLPNFMKYVTSAMLCFFLIFFTLDRLSFDDYWVIILQSFASTLLSVPLIYVFQLLFVTRKNVL
jgi:hypothetical protein